MGSYSVMPTVSFPVFLTASMSDVAFSEVQEATANAETREKSVSAMSLAVVFIVNPFIISNKPRQTAFKCFSALSL